MHDWYEFLGATEVDEKEIRARIFGSLPRISRQRRSKPKLKRCRYKQMELVGDSRYKYFNEQWVVSAKAHYHHGASEWMESQISFDHFKITTELGTTDATMIPLVTMQKYVPLLSCYYY
ncbi:hypothetical protein B9Z55_007612 [Caenorhabditis nigoni]|uniref:T-box domain-containing protein n=1 Tax=Caenorhabditis nigoni TaxID=1611254 RepID=A0A2G5VB28_9PELO|nr:hypothetical protein B9Z55_007612 [Caenorhabditis nigoni]